MRHFAFPTLLALGVAVCFSGPVFGQEAERNEIGGFTGLLHSEEANEFVVGGDYTRVAARHLAIDAQLDYSRKSDAGFTTNSYLLSAGPQYLIPTHSKIKPYVGAGAGVLHESTGAEGWGAASVDKFAVEVGGGIRVDATKRWGLNPEFKVIKAMDFPVFERATFGVFYRF